jgi:citrate lyase beta subunit
LRNALTGEAHAVVCDLEDGVAPAEKERARELVVRALADTESACARMVRVNGVDSRYFRDDVEGLEGVALDAVVLPKAMPDGVRALGPTGAPILAIIETAAGLRLAYETACEPRVFALALGAADLGAELGLEPRPDGLEILYARSKLVADSAAAGVRAPFDVVHLDVRDAEGLETECLLARSLGLRGKLCIHPAQVSAVNRLFAPTPAEIDWAERVVSAFESGVAAGRGAVGLEGMMVDRPVVERARQVMEEAKGARAR